MRTGPGTYVLSLLATVLLAGAFNFQDAHAQDFVPGKEDHPPVSGELFYRFTDKKVDYSATWPGTDLARRKGYPVLKYVTLTTPDPEAGSWRPRLFLTAKFGRGQGVEYYPISTGENQAPLETSSVKEYPEIWKNIALTAVDSPAPPGALRFNSEFSKVNFWLSMSPVLDRDPVKIYLGDLIPTYGSIEYPGLIWVEVDEYETDTRKRDYPSARTVAFVLPYKAPPGSRVPRSKSADCPEEEKAHPSALANISAKSQFAPTQKTLYVANRYSVYALPLDLLVANATGANSGNAPAFLATQDHIIARLKAARAQYDADPARQEACAVRWADCVQDMVDQAYLAAARD